MSKVLTESWAIPDMENVGTVETVKNEICVIRGIRGIGLSNVVEFSSQGQGIVLGFNGDTAQVAMLRGFEHVKRGDLVRIVAEAPTIKVGEELLGRVVDPLGKPLDGKGAINDTNMDDLLIETIARPIYQRRIIDQPLHTGYGIIDSQIPIGLGQRELLLGERQSGQNDLAIDIICNQTRLQTGLICVYVAIDAETAGAKRRIERLQAAGALDKTVVVMGRSAQAASLNYITPMVGTTIAEYFAGQGKDVLVVYDDLTRHAKVYRQMSLLLNRPASREAYPGDIFYLHSRLLERCGAFNQQGGGGTITALPIVETPTEEATDYITTNLMSITDGHVLFKRALANKGVHPPIDSGFSVSRIGGRAQVRLVRELSEKMKSVIIRYAEIERFLAFGSDMNEETRASWELGRRAYEMFDQSHDDYYDGLQLAMLMFFVLDKAANDWEPDQLPEVKKALLAYMKVTPYDSLINDTLLQGGIDDAVAMLRDCLHDFRHHGDTPEPRSQKTHLVAETETLSGLLHDSEEMFNGKKEG